MTSSRKLSTGPEGVTGRAGNRAGQRWAGPKLAKFFRAKILVAQLALKIGLVESNSLLKAKKIRAEAYWARPNLAQFFSSQ